MTKKEENKKTTPRKRIVVKKDSQKKSELWSSIQNQLLDFGSVLLKKGITNLAVAKINETEVEIQKVVEEKIQKHSKKIIKTLIKTIAIIFAASFLSYGVLELILNSLNLLEYQNLIFGLIFTVVALLVNSKK